MDTDIMLFKLMQAGELTLCTREGQMVVALYLPDQERVIKAQAEVSGRPQHQLSEMLEQVMDKYWGIENG